MPGQCGIRWLCCCYVAIHMHMTVALSCCCGECHGVWCVAAHILRIESPASLATVFVRHTGRLADAALAYSSATRSTRWWTGWRRASDPSSDRSARRGARGLGSAAQVRRCMPQQRLFRGGTRQRSCSGWASRRPLRPSCGAHSCDVTSTTAFLDRQVRASKAIFYA